MMIRKEYDTKLLADIWLRASLKAHSFISPSYWHDSYELMRTQYLTVSDNYVYVDQSCGKVLGFISMTPGFIQALFVDPTHQGSGVGYALLNYVKEIYPRLQLGVYERNELAEKFYQRNGFKVNDRRIEMNTGEMELVMFWERGEVLE